MRFSKMGWGSFVSALALTTLATCKVDDHASPAPVLSRATPATVSDPDAWKLFDRSVASGYIPGGKPLTVSLDSSQLLLGYKINGPAPYRLSITAGDGSDVGFTPLDLSRLPRGWQMVMSDDPVHVDKLQLVFTPVGAPSPVPELELWIDSDSTVASKPDLTEDIPLPGYVAFKSAPGPDNLSPGSCKDFPLELGLPPSELVHAYVVYATTGAFRSFSIQRSVNGLAPAGGSWLGGDAAEHVFVDQIDPESLQAGTNTVRLCSPPDATNRVSISHVRVVGELDRGTQFANSVSIGDELRDGSPMLDGNTGTVAKVASGEPVVIDFERFVAPDMLHLVASNNATPTSVECMDRAQHATPLRVHRIGTDVGIEGATSSCAALRLAFGAAVDIAELRVIGSGAADRTDWPRMVITSAPEHFGDTAWVGGFTVRPQSASGGNHVVISGKASDALVGDFGDLVHRASANDGTPWSVDVDATFSDGSTDTRTIVFDRDERAALAAAKNGVPVGATGDGSRFSIPGASVVVHALPTDRAEIRLGSSVGVDVPVGAVIKPTDVTVRHLPDATLPPLDPGMVNVTAPKGHGYEFLPHGQRFAKAVETVIPYDTSLLPASMGPDDVHTYFYDPTTKHWQKLDRTAVDVGAQVIHSATNHFTIMINAVLAVPSNPSPMMMDPTSLSSIPAANPASGIDLIEPPSANSMGDARTALPIRLPSGRGAYTPSLGFNYSSGSENSWMGIGWDLSVSSVGIDTRWGVPTYADGEELRYMLDGAELVPSGDDTIGPSCVDGSTGRRYQPRVEGSFAYIQRCGTDPSNYWFEVTDTKGTLYIYGSEVAGNVRNTSLLSTKPRPATCSGTCPPGVARWYLNVVRDIHGNEATYTYAVDDITGAEPGRDAYLSSISYTSHSTGLPPNDVPDLAANYTVDFIVDNGTFRPDKIISGRGGFKQVTRKLLHSVRVKSGSTVVRQYVLTYSHGQFEKTLLTSIKEYGLAGCSVTATQSPFTALACSGAAFLDEHTFSYMSENQAFDPPASWTVNDDPYAAPYAAPTLGRGNSTTNFGSLSIGVTDGDPENEVVNVGINTSVGTRSEAVGMYDLNGDGLPDQAYGTSPFSYTYNHGGQFSAAGGPPIDPAHSPSLGKENHASWGIDARLSGLGASVSAGYSNSTSRAKRLLADVDGDGYVDVVDAENSTVKLSGPCAGGYQCFMPNPFGALATINPALDPLINATNTEIKSRGIPGDPVVQWTAPYSGTITINTSVMLLTTSTFGVTVSMYRDDVPISGASGPVTAISLPFSWTGTLTVTAGEHFYLRVANGQDDGVSSDGLHNKVNASMSVSYSQTCNDAGCLGGKHNRDAGLEPTGSSVYDFALPLEQRLVPSPTAFPSDGHVRLHGRFNQGLTADDIVTCIKLIPSGASTDSPCSDPTYSLQPNNWFFDHLNDVNLTQLLTHSVLVDLDFDVHQGDRLVLRAESTYTIDPKTITFDAADGLPRLAYATVCDPDASGSSCTSTTDTDTVGAIPLDVTSFGIYVVPVSPPLLAGTPPYPLIITQSGQYSVSPFPHPFHGTIPITIAARSNRYGTIKVITCGMVATCNAANEFGWIKPGLVGDSLSFEVLGHGMSFPAATTAVTIKLDGGIPFQVPLIFRDSVPTEVKTPFVGGYRGWRNAFWNENVTFAPTEIIDDYALDPRCTDKSQPGCLPASEFTFLQNALEHTIMIPVASTAGTTSSIAPAWITKLGDAFIATNGDMNGGNIGGGSAGGLLPEGGLYEGGYARLSTSRSYFVSGSTSLKPLQIDGTLGASVGQNDTTTTTDLVDLNGDGVLDAIGGSQTYAGRISANAGPQLTNMQFTNGFRVRSGFDYSLSGGGAARDTSAGGRAIAEYVPPDRPNANLGYSHTVALQMGRSQETDDLIDINGDGLPDKVSRRGTSIRVQYNLGNQFGALETIGTLDATMNQSLDTFQSVEQTYSVDSTSNALSHDTTVTEDDTTVVNVVFATFSKNTHQTSSRTPRQLVDINGDGLPDLVLKKGANQGTNQQIWVQLNRGSDFGPSQQWATPSWGSLQLGPSFSTNFASLLLTGTHVINDNDVLAGTSSQKSRTYSGELVFPIDVVNIHVNLATTNADDTYELALMDIDGDGVADHVLRHATPTDTSIHFKRNQVTGRANLLQTVHRPLGGSFTLDYTWAGNTQDMPHRRQVLSRVEVDDGIDLGSQFASPNLVTTFTYEGGYYHRNEKTFMGFSKVSTFRADGGRTEEYFENHSLPLMGHLKEEIRYGLDASSNEVKFSDRVITTQVLDVKDSSNAVVEATPECMAALPDLLQRVGDVACRPQLPIVVEDDTTRSEGGQTKTRRIHTVRLDASGKPKIDRYGNVLESLDEGDDSVSTDDIYAVATYSNNIDYWILGLPTTLVVRQGLSGQFLRSRSGTYIFGTPDLQAITVTTGQGTNPVTTLGYDPYGNLNHITTPANANGEVQTYDVTFDTITQTYPISKLNAFGDKSTASYDVRWGVPLSEVDPSGGKRVYTYDKFGRVLTVATNYDPTGTTTLTMEYHPEENPARAITTSHGSAISTYTGPLGPNLTTATFIDGLGRTIEMRKSAAVDGTIGTTTNGAVQRDIMGHVVGTYQPFFTAGASTLFYPPQVTTATTMAYDKFDRVIAVSTPDTPQAATEYTSYDITTSSNGLVLYHTTNTAANSRVRETFSDDAGRTREFVEHPDLTPSSQPAITTYDYLPTGELTSITDAEGNQTSLHYDYRGLRLSMTSPDTGTITQTFDDMGNRTSMTDANHAAIGKTVQYVYSRDRLASITYPTATKVARFTYTKGRITGITDETGTRTYVYGSLGEIKEDIRTIKNSSNVNVTFDTKFTYDSLGRQLEILYPDGTSVRNTYDEGGLLSSVTGTGSGWSRVYADQIQYDVFGHRKQIRYGNNVVTKETYEPLRARLSTVQTTLPSTDQIQNLTYGYDAASNPTSIANNLAGLTSSSGNHPGKSTLTLTYDGADQLFTATGSADVDATTSTTYTETTHYSLSHNIKDKSRDHQLKQGSTITQPTATNFSSTYAYLPAHPHLPDTIAGQHIGYDPNGNPTQRFDINGATQTLVWDDDNRLIQVIGAFGTQNNIYDSGGLRVRRDSGTQHTIFASQYFDLEGTNQSIKHIYVGGGRVASVLDTNYVGVRNPTPPATSGTPYFFHDDHLGSTTVVTSDTGTVQESHEFFSDGELWIDRTPASPQNRYLFNGKPFDRDTGFYDFGQRFYDPRSGLWLGADPAFLGTPGEAVSKPMMMSVSAYCAQSPVRITDPDGRDYPSTAAGKALWWAAFKQGGGGHFRDPPNFNWDTYAKGSPSPAEALATAREAYFPTYADAAGPIIALPVAVPAKMVGGFVDWAERLPSLPQRLVEQSDRAANGGGYAPGDAETVGDMFMALDLGSVGKPSTGALHSGGGGPSPSPSSARFVVTPDGVAIPTSKAEVLSNVSQLDDVSTNPSSSGKFTGTDSGGPIRVRIEKAHPADPAFTGTPDPLHTVDHMHIDRRANGSTGSWRSKEKIQFTWPF